MAMRLVSSTDNSKATPEGMFASKYAWLLRWAMHFAQNDRAIAEDMVQETFLKLLLSWSSLHDLDNIEPLLYSYLKYTHLSEQRRGLRYSFQSLSTIDFDTVAISLERARGQDRFELQAELRRVVSFLLWRRTSARFASIFLLRYFHGYFPEEIMQICRATRHAVDLSLRYAREELRSHLKNPGRIEVMHAAAEPVDTPFPSAFSARDVTHDLQTVIFAANYGDCLSSAELSETYKASSSSSLSTDHLAHIVSCRSCLEQIGQRMNLKPPHLRDTEKSIGNAPRGRKTGRKSADTMQQQARRTIAAAQRRMDEIEQHLPSGLQLVLNGRTIAMRDLNSPRAKLMVEVDTAEKIWLIEVESDEGLPLLCFPLQHLPPRSSPEEQHSVRLQNGRSVHLSVRFTATGAEIETTYEDPNAQSYSQATCDARLTDKPSPFASESKGRQAANGMSSLIRWLGSLFHLFTSKYFKLIATAALASICLLIASLWRAPSHHRAPVTPEVFLQKAAAAEKTQASAATHSAIHQAVRITTAKGSIRRDLYRDGAQKRRPKEQPLSQAEQALQQKLLLGAVNWNDPLSPSGFLSWHGDAARYHDRVGQAGDLITLHTSVPNGPISEESLTVREVDFHPVRRELAFRDQSEIEITEVDYELLPWNKSTEDWFEPVAGKSRSVSDIPTTQRLPGSNQLSERAVAESELETLLELRRLHGDTERLSVDSNARGVVVRGVVESEERKHELTAQLQAIPHVTTLISSYQDLSKLPSSQTANTSVSMVNAVSGRAPMESFCSTHAIAREDCTTLSHGLLQQAAALDHEVKEIHLLEARFHDPSELTQMAQANLHQLLEAHWNSLYAALLEQKSILSSLHGNSPSSDTPQKEASLGETASRNLDLTKELLYASNTSGRNASLILDDLAGTTKQLQLQTDTLRDSLSAPSAAVNEPKR